MQALAPVVPLFLLVALGFLFAGWKRIHLGSLTEILVYLSTPALIFTSLSRKPLAATDLAALALGAVALVAGVGLLVAVYFALFRFRSPGFALPCLFMNAGNIGIPLALFAFGEEGLQRGTLIFVVMAFLQNTVGVYLLNRGTEGWREVFRLPLVYAAFLGLAFNLARLPIPAVIFEPLQMLGSSSIPLMLVSLGYRLRDLRAFAWGHAVGGAALRIAGGLAVGYFAASLLGATGTNRQVLLLYSALPSAVVNFVLAEKYGQDPELAASIVFLTTTLSLVTIPLVLWLVR